VLNLFVTHGVGEMHNVFFGISCSYLGERWLFTLSVEGCADIKNIVHFYSFMRGQSLAHGEVTLVRIGMLTERYS